MPLGMEVGLSPVNFVLDEDPAPTPKGAEPHPIFGPHLLWPNGCMKTPLGTDVDLDPGHTVLDRVPAPARGARQLPLFRPMSIVDTVAHLSYC